MRRTGASEGTAEAASLAVIALIAERTKEATPEMRAEYFKIIPDYLESPATLRWQAMHRASALCPKEGE